VKTIAINTASTLTSLRPTRRRCRFPSSNSVMARIGSQATPSENRRDWRAMRQLTSRFVADCGQCHIPRVSIDLTLERRSLEGVVVAQLYDFEVQSNGGTIAAIRSVEVVREPGAMWLQIAELADCSFGQGCRIVVTDQQGEMVMLLGLETDRLGASQRRRCAPGTRGQPPLQRSQPLPVILTSASVELTRHVTTHAGNQSGGS
jgi:hypothetical protein